MQINMAGFNMGMRITADNFSNNKTNTGFKNSQNAGKCNAFGAQCKVTISHEGRQKSGQAKDSAARSVTEMQMERMMIREQKQAEESKNEYSGTLNEISELMKSIQNSYEAGEDKETIQKKQDALDRMLELKKRQEEENEQRVKDAMKSASGSPKEQAEIDRKNEELLLLLKSLEEREEDGTDNGGSVSETAGEEQGSAGEQLQESAAMLGASAARRELQTKGAIDGLKNDGYSKLAEVNAIMGDIREELRSAAEAAGKEYLSDEEKEQLVSGHMEAARATLAGNYGYMAELRKKGLQEIKDSRELELRHIEINPLGNVKNARQTIMGAGVDAALRDAASGILDKASQELEDKVQAELDKRNDIAADPGKKTEEEEKRVEEEKTEEEKNSILNQLII